MSATHRFCFSGLSSPELMRDSFWWMLKCFVETIVLAGCDMSLASLCFSKPVQAGRRIKMKDAASNLNFMTGL